MFTPTIFFRRMPHSTERDWLYGFIFNNTWGWSRYIFQRYPQLRRLAQVEKESDRLSMLNNFIDTFHNNRDRQIDRKLLWHEKEWRKVESSYFQVLSGIIGEFWPRKKITAYLSINPICPRFLKTWGFGLFYGYHARAAREVIMHECAHFLHFRKWRRLFPGTNDTHYEWPHLEWHLSEIAAPIVLNDGRVQRLLRKKADFYEEHHSIHYGRLSAPIYFSKLYRETCEKPDGYDVFLRQAYSIMRKTKKKWVIVNSQ